MMKKNAIYKRRRILFYWLASVVVTLTVLQACQSRIPVPTWHNLKPGSSTSADVVRELGEPTYKITDDKSGYIGYLYGQGGRSPNVIVQNDTVKLIKIYGISGTTGEMLNQYGEPERITWSSYDSPCFKRLFIYGSQGIAFVADNATLQGAVVEQFYFTPRSADDFLTAFAGSVLPAENPCSDDEYPEDFWQR